MAHHGPAGEVKKTDDGERDDEDGQRPQGELHDRFHRRCVHLSPPATDVRVARTRLSG
jgi:hypothetical protein